MYKFGTIPWSHTNSTLSKYFRPMNKYMNDMNRSTVAEGVEAVLSGYGPCLEWCRKWREVYSLFGVAQKVAGNKFIVWSGAIGGGKYFDCFEWRNRWWEIY